MVWLVLEGGSLLDPTYLQNQCVGQRQLTEYRYLPPVTGKTLFGSVVVVVHPKLWWILSKL